MAVRIEVVLIWRRIELEGVTSPVHVASGLALAELVERERWCCLRQEDKSDGHPHSYLSQYMEGTKLIQNSRVHLGQIAIRPTS